MSLSNGSLSGSLSGSSSGGLLRPSGSTMETGGTISGQQTGSLIGSTSQSATKPKSMKEEEDEILREICSVNGLNYNKIENGEVFTCTVLEMFFSGMPRIVAMRHFPNVTCLTVVDQQIQKIEGLSCLTNLKELWISETEVKRIESIGSLKKLQKLYLFCNKISKIENLDHLVDLEVLWLNSNSIVHIENLSSLCKLRELNLAQNCITKIGHTLDANQSIEDLNLSGNNISSLRDLTHLMRLSKLKSLSMKDPNYSPAPVSLLCNYSTHVLYHMPHLATLDTYDVSKSIVDMAETTVMKKKMYYNMRVKTVRRNMVDILSKMEIYKQRLHEFPRERIRALASAIKEVRSELEEMHDFNILVPVRKASNSSNDEEEEQEDEDAELVLTVEIENQARLQHLDENGAFAAKLTAIKERMKKWEKKSAEIESFMKEAVKQLQQSCDTLVNRMVLELESGGNVRFEEGTTSDVWFSSCHDLVLSRFCATDFKDHGISGVKIHRIIRVHNRMLRTQFDEKLVTIVDDGDGEYYPCNRNTSYKKQLEYLFWMWDPLLLGGVQEPMRVLEEGYMDSNTYKDLGRDGAVPLSNSLSLADRHRIKHLTKTSNKVDACPFRYGHLIISKVYLGKSVKAMDDRQITRSSYPKIDAVFKPRKMCQGIESHGDGSNSCECSARQCEWYIFDNELVLPEYIVEFEYVTKFRPRSPFSYFNDLLLDNRECKLPAVPHGEEEKQTDDDVLNMEPVPKQRPRMVGLTEELLLKAANTDSLENITVLNLHGNGLTKLRSLQALKSLRRLVVSFNDLTKLDDLAYTSLEYLDAGFNKISTLEGMKNMYKLKFLDLSWNKLLHTRDELSILRKHICNLVTLDLRSNNWQKPENLRLRVIGRLKSLTLLDGSAVTENEATSALRVAAGSRISQLSLLTHGRTDESKPRSLNLLGIAQILEKMSRLKPEKFGESDSQWYSKVTTLNMDNQHITKLSGLERMDNLKYATFNNNDITKIEGLDQCTSLEELSLENNCVARLEGISKLVNLRRLSLGSNYITSVENAGLQFLVLLVYLSMENNKLTSLAGMQKMSSLVELYVGNNLIYSVREVFYLKVLSNLVILDLFGNPVATEIDNYRLFVIYHLKNLKALDGVAIIMKRVGQLEATEGSMAKDTFGGRLTPDFVAEKLSHSNFQDVRELDLPNCSIRIVDLGAGDTFINLRSVNLEHNNLTSFSGLIHLPNIRVLCLNHNHIECIMPKSKPVPRQKTQVTMANVRNLDFLNDGNLTPIMENLEVLHLGYNSIKDMATLQLSRLTSLKALFLQGNDITKVEGIEGLHDLRELVLDRNRIKNISEMSFANQWNLQELHMEENRIRDLSNLNCMEHLQRMYLGSNRIQEVSELQKLEGLVNLIEISLVNNAAARRHLHRPILVFKLKQLLVIDGLPVSEEERTKAELYFMDQQPVMTAQGPVSDGTLPGIGQYKTQVPVKVTTMNLGTSPMWNGGVMYDNEPTDSMQRVVSTGGGRRRATKGSENGNGVGLNRGNTVVNMQQGQGYGGFSYTTNAGNRPQFYLNQIPYVNPPTQSEINQAKNNKR
ncbi:leucine-rich repeat-containing protein 9-like isoform X3 [Mizuhopecten yessoensis]|uniref:leucine-rich repeat-containing protein 9-like isoform X3 n=1 Tax=Mizuhopecten yessoensis TaxID=6573 RepID=UPI000B45BE22|nr:leucine-rich repeat-containing protein 9-like isoform X3 [Mizuhopecten yessoensis]